MGRPRKAVTLSAPERLRNLNTRLVAAGGRQITVRLSPEAAAALASLCPDPVRGEIKAAIEHALIEAAARRR